MVIESGTGIAKEEILKRISDARGLMRGQGLAVLLVIGRSFYDRMGSLTYLTNHFPPFPPGAFSPAARLLLDGPYFAFWLANKGLAR